MQLIQVGRKIKMIKFDKHPNGKLRRNYKDMVSVECVVETIAEENAKCGNDVLS